MDKVVLLLILCGSSCFLSVSDDTWRCHNHYKRNNEVCRPKAYHKNNSTLKCQVCENYNWLKFNLTVCDTVQFDVTVQMIFEMLPLSTEYLLIRLDNTWNGYLPLSPDPIILNNIGRLNNLKYFELTDTNYKFFEMYPLQLELSAVKNLTKLHSLAIRIPIIDDEHITLGDIVGHLPGLELLDLSYTRGLGGKSLHRVMKMINRNIKHLCFRKIQLIGGVGYSFDFKDVFKNLGTTYPELIEWDLSDNTIARLSPGISYLAPNLLKLDISGNMLLDTGNMAVLVESFMHPNLVVFNAGFQGFAGRNPDPWLKSDEYTPMMTNYAEIYHSLEINNFDEIPKSFDDLKKRQWQFLTNCMNVATSGNITHAINNANVTCNFIKCLLPTFFKEFVCDVQRFLPAFNDIYNYECMLNMMLPIGENLQEFYFSSVHLEQGQTVGFTFNGKLCIGKNNSLHVLRADGNQIWMQSAQLGKILTSIEGIEGFDNLKSLSMSNNSVDVNSTHSFTGVLPNVEYVDISGNKANFSELCLVVPNLQTINLKNSNISNISPNLFRNCSRLENIYLGYNRYIDVRSLNKLNFTGTTNIKRLDLNNNFIHTLEYEFLNIIDQFQNITIDISYNTMSCNCSEESINFTKWVIKSKDKLHNFHKYYCSGPGGLIFFGDIDINTLWNQCRHYNLKDIIISVATTLGVVSLICAIFAIYKIRWRLRYILFSITQFMKSLKYGKDSHSQIWKYDAFISYCAEDRFWVHDTLMKTLENKYGFRLCIHYRDFPVGGDVAETIGDHMAKSRELVIVLSDIALRSEWCQFELDEALIQVNKRNQRLFVIKLGKIRNELLLSSKIAHVLDSHTFMEWSDNNKHHKLFWATLVARLYSDPEGGWWNCCCPYGSKSLGYKDIVDPHLDDDDSSNCEEEEEEELVRLPENLQDVWQAAKQAKIRVKKAKAYIRVLEKTLDGEGLPNWAYGPAPWPIEQFLKSQNLQFDNLVYTHATQRLELMIKCLSEHTERDGAIYTRNRMMVDEVINKYNKDEQVVQLYESD